MVRKLMIADVRPDDAPVDYYWKVDCLRLARVTAEDAADVSHTKRQGDARQRKRRHTISVTWVPRASVWYRYCCRQHVSSVSPGGTSSTNARPDVKFFAVSGGGGFHLHLYRLLRLNLGHMVISFTKRYCHQTAKRIFKIFSSVPRSALQVKNARP